MMMFADDAFSNLVDLFCKACQLHAAGVAPNKCGLPKCIGWPWKLLKAPICWVTYSMTPLSGARKFTPSVFCQVNNAFGFPCPCVTVHEANEWKKNMWRRYKKNKIETANYIFQRRVYAIYSRRRLWKGETHSSASCHDRLWLRYENRSIFHIFPSFHCGENKIPNGDFTSRQWCRRQNVGVSMVGHWNRIFTQTLFANVDNNILPEGDPITCFLEKLKKKKKKKTFI